MPTPTAPASRRPRTVLGGVVAVVVVGTAARFFTTTSLWLDEALSVNIASLPLGDLADALRRDGHPPLYYWLLHGWIEVFGDGDVAVRSLSGVLSLATLPLIWRAGREVAGRDGGLWAVVILALSPFAVRYGTEARMYALVMLLVTAGYLAVRSVLRRPTLAQAVLLAAVTGALLWTHYWALYLGAAAAVAVAIRWWRVPKERRASAVALAGLAGGAVLFTPWLPTMLEQAAHTGTPWGTPARPTTVLATTLTDLGGGGFAEAQLLGVVVAVLFVVAAFGRRGDHGQVVLGDTVDPTLRREMAVIAGTLLIGTAAGYASGGAFASRYASVVVPLVVLVAAVGMARLDGWLRIGMAVALLGLSAVGIAYNVTYQRTQVDELAATIEAQAAPGDIVVACPDQLGPSLQRALRHADPPLDVVPYPLAGDARLVDWRDYAERNAQADPQAFAEALLTRAGDSGIWVVWNGTYRTLSGQCEAMIGRLSAERAGTVLARPGDAYEPAMLTHFG